MKTMYLDISAPRIVLTRLLARFSRNAYYAPTSALHLTTLAEPPLPAPDWTRIRNRMCGICGSDLHQLTVDAGLDVAPVALPSHQRIYLGHEMVGTIIEIGNAVRDFKMGDRVVRWGRADDCVARGRQELCPACARGHRVLCEVASEEREHHPIGGGFGDTFITPASTLLRVPDSLSDEQATLIEPAAVAIHAASRVDLPGFAKSRSQPKILVLGCGVIGYLLIQALCAFQPDCDITALAQFDWQAELACKYGANRTFLSRDDGYVETARITGAKIYASRGNRMLLGGFDVVFDVVGIESTLNNALRWTRAGGTVVLVGVNLHRMKLDVTPVWYQEVNLIGAVGHDVVNWNSKNISTFELAMEWMQSTQLKTAGLVTHHFPLDDYRTAFNVAIDKRTHRSIKVVFDLSRT
ncbi:MAG: alcohol dehydrogenase catalytic domain-containing protein [Chloroflexi bacterium]|nr:alcohol dehydrogenase catalytic domain-containing protein [Chloroflexota bacterium]